MTLTQVETIHIKENGAYVNASTREQILLVLHNGVMEAIEYKFQYWQRKQWRMQARHA